MSMLVNNPLLGGIKKPSRSSKVNWRSIARLQQGLIDSSPLIKRDFCPWILHLIICTKTLRIRAQTESLEKWKIFWTLVVKLTSTKCLTVAEWTQASILDTSNSIKVQSTTCSGKWGLLWQTMSAINVVKFTLLKSSSTTTMSACVMTILFKKRLNKMTSL